MCGIAGIIDPALDKPAIGALLQRMTDSIIHRGPDDEGAFVADGAGIGMRRLSIIDVAGGHQPIGNEDGAIQVVFNGEIYNYRELRAGLEQRGHRFRTNSDTEVIAHLYEERGAGCLSELRGMFGIAVWDARTSTLMLGRDRLGKKPLFYAQHGGQLVFGSEIKALLAAAPALAEQNLAALEPYFRFGFVPEPYTMFRDISKLPPGHWLIWREGRLTIAPYWRLQFAEAGTPAPPLAQVREELDALLEEAVRVRLMSEVPLGIFLSGGLDSSAVVAYAHRAGLRPIKTFTIGFDQPEWDESADAALVARHFGTDHHVLTLRAADLAADLPGTVLALVRHFDEPFGDPSALPTYHVSRLAREHVTVILGGDGGDELFAGYSSYRGIRFAEQYQRLPHVVGSGLSTVARAGAGLLPAGRRYRAQRLAKVLSDSLLPFETMYFSKAALCDAATLGAILAADVRRPGQGAPLYQDDTAEVLRSTLPTLSKAAYLDLRFSLLGDMLVKVDRMSMAHALEMRSPLLDHKLVEFAASLPPELKLRGWESKAILRDVLRPMLPAATMQKRKQGFGVPLRSWLRGELWQMVSDYLGAENGGLPPELFDRAAVQRLIVSHHRGDADHSAAIWLLLNYAAWYRQYIP
jgi:asparagine synthase (glutamine-hydrolysing)